jgi:hypothetical protein
VAKRELVFNYKDIGCTCGEAVICLYDSGILASSNDTDKYCLKVQVIGVLNTKVKNIIDSKTNLVKEIIVYHDYKVEYDDSFLKVGKYLTCKDIRSFCCFGCGQTYLEEQLNDCLKEETITHLVLDQSNNIVYSNEAGQDEVVPLGTIINNYLSGVIAVNNAQQNTINSMQNKSRSEIINAYQSETGVVSLDALGEYLISGLNLTVVNPNSAGQAIANADIHFGGALRFQEGGLAHHRIYINGDLVYEELVDTINNGNAPQVNDVYQVIRFAGFDFPEYLFDASETKSFIIQYKINVTNAPTSGSFIDNGHIGVFGTIIGKGF